VRAVDRVRSIYARLIGELRAGDGDLDALRRRAEALGAETFYWDDQGNYHDADPESLRSVVAVLEADAQSAARRSTPPVVVGSGGPLQVGPAIDHAGLTFADGTTVDLDVIAGQIEVPEPLPIGCHALSLTGRGVEQSTTIVTPPAEMPTSPTLAGRAAMFAPAYALWEHDAPLPSFTHLASLGSMLPTLGVDALITLPLYASFLDEPFDPSPYAPISRLHWNEAYIDDAGLPEAPVPPIGALIDWRAISRRRRTQLLDAVGTIPGRLTADVQRFVADNPDVADYARFRAKVAVDPTDATRPSDVVEASHQLAQYLCHAALSQLHEPDRAAFALDLPIGSHPLGYETWANPDLFATGMGVGAPPDTMYPDGQNWGFPPQLPGAAERSGFALWRTVVRRCGRYASLLRIDHVLGVHRLWWIPDGMGPDKGVYVRYPRSTLLAVIAAEAACAGTTVVGEDLGTVPEAITEAMEEWRMLGLYAEHTQLDGDELPTIPARTVAGMRTHDMEPFAMLYQRGDLVDYGRKLRRSLGRPVGSSVNALLTAALARLATSDAYLVFADLDDLLGEVTPHNIPGKVLPTIWRRRLRRPTSETLADPDVRRLLGVLTERRR
jgi:4-alpha-glucanotransferase